MAIIKSGNTTIDVSAGKVTLITIKRNKELAERLKAASKPDAQAEYKRTFELLQRFPQLAEFMTASGDLNSDTIKREAERLGGEGEAREFIVSQLRSLAAMNPDVALALFFPPLSLRADEETLTVCIDVLKKTYSPDGLNKKEIALLESEITSDFWQNVESDGVIDYCQKFWEQSK